jgi:hypothetical protein
VYRCRRCSSNRYFDTDRRNWLTVITSAAVNTSASNSAGTNRAITPALANDNRPAHNASTVAANSPARSARRTTAAAA